MDKYCLNCKIEIEQSITGRPRSYCDDACRQAAYRSRKERRESHERGEQRRAELAQLNINDIPQQTGEEFRKLMDERRARAARQKYRRKPGRPKGAIDTVPRKRRNST